MIIPWIQVDSNLTTHRKTSRLADALGLSSASLLPNVQAVGILVSLWTWAAQNAYDGDLSMVSPRAIAEACQWKKKPEQLVKALKETGWLDPDGHLHDWDDYALRRIEAEEEHKAKNKERVRRCREKKKSDCNVTVTLQKDYVTPMSRPNNNNNNNNICGGGGERAHEAEKEPEDDPVESYCEEREIGGAGWLDRSAEEVKAEAEIFTASLYKRFVGRAYTDIDIGKVADYTMGEDQAEKRRLLMYAFEQAALSGKPGEWGYIDGIMRKLVRRGIKTLEQAQDYDAERS